MIALLMVLLGVARGASAGLYIYLWAAHFFNKLKWAHIRKVHYLGISRAMMIMMRFNKSREVTRW